MNEGECGKLSILVFISIQLILSSEELLIDFQELRGEHSGKNMAAVVWSTLEEYGIQNKVR